MPQSIRPDFDAVAADRAGRVVALIEVKTNPGTDWREVLPRSLASFPEPVDFVLAVDLREIQIYGTEGGLLGEPLAILSTPGVLSHYDTDFSSRRVFEDYLTTLVEAWLRDLAYHWKTDRPPGSNTLSEIGLLERLEGGSTTRAPAFV